MNIKQIISTIISFVLLHNQSLLAAELAIDASAPKANQAELIKAPNNVPIVNIVNPNSQGVSHNKFSNFNVTPQGIILNNSKAITNTELAGYISYNPKLTGSEAKLILNEVTGTKRTLLQGYTEVAGKSADIIIANPNGISVNGGGFINTPSATLTTGIPAFEGGLLRGFSIGGGGILIDGDGFNANNINKVNLYAKALEFNAKLYGDNLNIVTGENDIALDGVVSPKNKIGSGISLDSTLLGGIYANAITLQSTNKGIGVHLPPEVFAQNSLTLSANGDIVVSKAIAGENLDISSKTHSLSLTGGISANNLSLSAAKHIEIAPNQTLFASNHVTLQSDSLSNLGEINSLDGKGQSTLSVLDRLDNQGLIGGYNLNIKAKDIDNTGAIYSKNNLQVTSDTLDNSGLIRSNESIDLFIASHLTNQQEGVIYSDGDLSISSSPTKEKSNTLTNKGLIQSEKKINITANTLNNIAPSPIFKNSTTSQAKTVSRGGSNNYDIVTTTTQTEIIDIPSDPAMILASDNIHIDVNTLNNAYSLIASDENIVLNAFLANNIGKVIVTTIKTVTNQYRNERYCATSGPSGACFNHKDRAAYRGTFTSTQMERQPLANYGIQAQKSIQGNVVTLNNISSQLGDSLNDQQLQSKLAAMENLEDGTLSLQKAGTYLEASNEKALALLGADSDILDALSQVTTNEKLLNFKEGLETLKNSLGEIIEADKISIESLETTLESIRTSGILTDNVSLLVSALETSISQLKNNLATSETYLANFETIDASLAKPEDIKNHEQSLIDTNHEIKSLLIENSLIISTLDTTGLSNKFEQTSDLIRSEVNTALAQQTNVEHKIITANEGLYQTNTHHALSQTSPVSYTANNSAIIDGITLPKGKYGLFLLNKASDHPYLIESNPLYTNYQKFISSDYMLSKLDFRPENTQKRLGDAMYETQLVTQSIIKLSGNRYLAGYSSDLEQFQALMDNALSLRSDLNLEVGISLSQEQIARLNQNVVWLVEKEIDGERVLVPEVYLAHVNLNSDGAKILAGEIGLVVQESLMNDGLIASKGNLKVNTGSLLANQNGSIVSGGDLSLTSQGVLENLSGTLQSGGDLSLSAERLTSTALTQEVTYNYAQGYQTTTQKGKAAEISSKGHLTLQTQGDITLANTRAQAAGDIALSSAKGAVNIQTIETKEDYDFRFSNGYNKGNSITQNGSTLEGKNITIHADQVNVVASSLDAQEEMTLKSQTGVNILAANNYLSQETQIKTKGGLFGGKSTTKDETSSSEVVSSTLSAKNINVDTSILSIQGSRLTAEQAAIVSEIIELISLKNSEYESHFSDKSGFITRTIASKGHIREEVVPAILEVEKQLIINNKDVTQQLQIDNLLKTITSQSSLTLEQINLIKAYARSEEWNQKTTTLSGMGSLIVAAVATLGTMGMGGYLVGLEAASVTTTTSIQAAIAKSISTQLANALLTAAITGNAPVIDAASIAKTAALAGVMQYTSLTGYTNVGDLGYGNIVNKVAQSTVNAGIKTAIKGDSFKENLIDEAAQNVYQYVGDVSLSVGWNEGSLNKVILHSAVGASIAAAKGEDILAGAASGAMAEIARPLTYGQDGTIQSTVSSLIGGITAGVVGGDASVNVGSYIGQTSDQFNRQLHEKEVNFIEDNAQSFADAQGISLEDAKARLAQQGLRQTDKAWSYALGTETDTAAQSFLAQNAPTLFTVNDAYEFKDGTTNGQQEISSLSKDAYNQLKNFYANNVYVTTSTNSDGSMRPINEAFKQDKEAMLSSINGETINQTIRDFIPNAIETLADTPKTFNSASNYLENVTPTTTQERMDELYNQGNEGSKVQANLATMDVIDATTMATGAGAVGKSVVGSVVKDIRKSVDDSLDLNMKTISINGNQVELTNVGSKGNWDKLVNKDLKPDTAYQLDNGHTYITNAQGKVNYVEADLNKIAMDRNSYQQNVVGKSGEVNDQGGHLIASSLGGAGDRINLVPMDKVLNNGTWKKMESDLAKALEQGKDVNVKIDVGYPDGGGGRPNSFTVNYTIDGVVKKLPPFKQ